MFSGGSTARSGHRAPTQGSKSEVGDEGTGKRLYYISLSRDKKIKIKNHSLDKVIKKL